MASSTVAIIIIVITIAFFIWGKFPMSVVSMAGAVAMAILVPEVELSAVYEGFSSSGWIMVVGMCVVSAALFETGVAERIGKIIGNSWWGKSERRFVVVRIYEQQWYSGNLDASDCHSSSRICWKDPF